MQFPDNISYKVIMTGWITVSECPYCKHRGLNPYKSMVGAPIMDVEFCGGTIPMQTKFSFIQCAQCKMLIQSPRMSDERIALYYSSGIYRKTLESTVVEMDRGEALRAEQAYEWLAPLHVMPVKSHLDIGCSRGSFLKRIGAAKQYGYDYNSDYAVEKITVMRDRDKLPQCELVTALHVLEHTINPQNELKWYKSLSTRFVMVEVPRFDNSLRFPHLYYFPMDVLCKMFGKAGLKILETTEYPNFRILAEVS